MGGRGASSGAVKKFEALIEKYGGAKLSEFDQFRFEGLTVKDQSNNYYQMTRVSKDKQRIVVSVSEDHVFGTKYGYGLRLDDEHVAWLKDWQIGENRNGNLEVLLTKQYFNPKKWGDKNSNFEPNAKMLSWNGWKSIATKQQNAGNFALWRKKNSKSRKEYEFNKRVAWEYR